MKGETARWRRLTAIGLCAATIWGSVITAGSGSAEEAWQSVEEELLSPVRAVRWELGDLTGDLSPAAALTIAQSPLLLSAREQILRRRESETETAPPAESGGNPEPIREEVVTPAPASTDRDNGVPARTLVPASPDGYTVVGSVYISNGTDHVLDTAALAAGDFDASLTEAEPQVLILHTHGSESYTLPPGESYVASGDHRTTDTTCNVVRVGDEMAEVFGLAGISVLHDRTLYDYPSYAGSYDRSLVAIQNYLKQYPSIRFILDVHRDAIEDGQGNQYKVVSAIDGEGTAAQLSIVVGSDGSGLTHPNWIENLRLAVAIQENILAKYPTLMRPVLLRNSRYNQHATAGSLLVEVGSAGNSPEEAVLAGRLFAERMAEVLNAQTN